MKPEEFFKRADTLFSEKMSNWDSHVREVAKYFLPNKDQMTEDSKPKGEKKTVKLYDSTGVHSNELLAGWLQGTLTSPHSTFFDLIINDDEIMDMEEVRDWLGDSTLRLHRLLAASNFQPEVHEYYLDLTSTGTPCLIIEEDKEDVFKFSSRPFGEIAIDENHKGLVDVLFRKFEWSARKIMQRFKKEVEKDPKLKRDLMKDLDKKYTMYHGIYERDWFDAKKKTGPNKPIASIYGIKDFKKILTVGGFDEKPFAVSRWSKVPGEKYGRTPAMTSLADCKMINEMMITTLKAAQLSTLPPLQAPEDSFLTPFSFNPLAVNIYRQGSREKLEPIFQPQRVDFGYEAMNDVRGRIKQAFYIDKLQLAEKNYMTAREVNVRQDEGLRLLAPLLGRQETEFLKPVINRCFRMAFRAGKFKEVPEVLEGKTISVRYSSQIAKIQRESEVSNTFKAFEAVGVLAQADPSVMDVIDLTAEAKKIVKVYGLNGRSNKDIKNIREGRAQAEQEAIEAEKRRQEAENIQKAGPTILKAQGE